MRCLKRNKRMVEQVKTWPDTSSCSNGLAPVCTRLQAFNGSAIYSLSTASSRVRVRQQWWDSAGAPQRALGGWQLFPFKTKKEEVQGYGFSDGATGWGSMPDFCSITVLREITRSRTCECHLKIFEPFEAKTSEQKSA